MQNLYSPELRQAQDTYLDTAKIMDLADPDNATIVDSGEYRRRETTAWRAKLDAAPDSSEAILHAIINEWLTGCYDEEIAVGWLHALRLLPEAEEADCYEVMCHIAFFEFGPVALPERVSPPIQPTHANPDLVAALAPARAQGGDR